VSDNLIEKTGPITDVDRQRLLARIALASEVVSPFWPMRTFIHHNPLHGLEHLPFDDAVRKGQDLLGGRGYLSNEEYRRMLARGDLRIEDLRRAIGRLVPGCDAPGKVIVGKRRIEPIDVAACHILYGIEPLEPEEFRSRIRKGKALRQLCPDLPSETRARLLGLAGAQTPGAADPDGTSNETNDAESEVATALWSAVLHALDIRWREPGGLDAEGEAEEKDSLRQEVLETAFDETGTVASAVASAGLDLLTADMRSIGEGMTAGELCGRITGTDLVDVINREMIKWCSAFLDQGLAMWSTPGREKGFYLAWRELAARDLSGRFLGIRGFRRLVKGLPARSEDAIIGSLRALGVPEEAWDAYMERHIAQLPGYAGFIKWRSEAHEYRWSQRYPIELSGYLAARLFYERHLVAACCQETWGVEGTMPVLPALAIRFRRRPVEYFALRRSAEMTVPDFATRYHPAEGGEGGSGEAWARFGRILFLVQGAMRRYPWSALSRDAWRLFRLAQFLELSPSEVRAMPMEDARALLLFLDGLPPEAHGPIWLEAHEAHYREGLLSRLAAQLRDGPRNGSRQAGAPLAQAAFCIDVRSEGFRRHLEAVGDYETLGFAGFFGVPISFRGFGQPDFWALCPAITKPASAMVEMPEPGAEAAGERALRRSAWDRIFHALVQRLERHVASSYAVIDLLAWAFGLALAGRTLFPAASRRVAGKVHHWFVPAVSTRVTVKKPTRKEGEEIIDNVEREAIRDAIAARRLSARLVPIPPETVEEVRRLVLASGPEDPESGSVAALLDLYPEEAEELVVELRSVHGISPEGRVARLERLGLTGFTWDQRALYVETGLRGMGLTRSFARLVVLCGHGSTSLNNPYLAALDCGACGGNRGGPNARAFAEMANEPGIRWMLRERGIHIPADTWFLAAEHNTTTDRVVLYDTPDRPRRFDADLARLRADLEEAGDRNAQERCARLPGSPPQLSPRAARRHAERRSADIAQVRPEWGLSGNAAFIVAHRSLTRGVDLGGRVFLHSYDWERDARGTVLELIMTAPLIVGEWISMEHYFSTVDNRVYGSDTKVIHNVVGGFGVMLGSGGDIQTGLPKQTVMAGEARYHDPLRLLVVMQAPTERIEEVIQRHHALQHLFDHGWVNLVALDPPTGSFHLYRAGYAWEPLAIDPAGARGAS
jgi:uncharacterized protein YbcC (UPF0753/DUF2309 family)